MCVHMYSDEQKLKALLAGWVRLMSMALVELFGRCVVCNIVYTSHGLSLLRI